MDKLIYIANIRLPTEKAHGIQIMEMCGAFADAGVHVELVVPRRRNAITQDPFAYHDVKRNFSIRRLWCIDAIRFGRPGFYLETITFNVSAFFYALGSLQALYYTRDEATAVWLELCGYRSVWEGHMGHTNVLTKTLIWLGAKMVVITEALKTLYVREGARPEDIIVAADGADLKRFDIGISKEDARKRLGLPLDKTILLYKGSLQAWKGADTLAEAASLARSSGLLFVFMGGTEADVAAFKQRFGDRGNVAILGNRPRQETPVYQKAADILVIPNSAKEDISKLYTSPMKLFGYRAGGRPIIASDLPSLREILSDDKAYFFAPDDAESLAQTIATVLGEMHVAEGKAAGALELASEYSWQKRAESILAFMRTHA